MPEPTQQPAGLYLVLNLGGQTPAQLKDALSVALPAAPVATVLLTAGTSGALNAALAKELIGIGQKQGVAMLLADDAGMARSLKADGVHLTWCKEPIKKYREARDTLGAHAIIGADAGRSRHDAMELGEGGADYIAFGIPPHVEDIATARDRQADLLVWWRDIFEIPCVAIDVASLEDAEMLTRSGADFVAVTLPADVAPADLKTFVKALAAGIAAVEETS